MPNYSGVWTLQEQYEAILEGNWTGIILSGSELYAWGEGDQGRSGRGSAVDQSSPAQIGSSTRFSDFSGGYRHSLAVDGIDNTLWGWGYNAGDGPLGDDTRISKSSPIQVNTSTDWSQVSADNSQSYAIKTDGTLWSWGARDSGVLGQNDLISRSSPTQVGALTNWSEVGAGMYFTLAIKTDGTLWSWGSGVSGALGNNSELNRSSPVQIASGQSWAAIAAGSRSGIAVTTTGALYVWGAQVINDGGVSGNLSSPVQVGALTDWYDVAAGNGYFIMQKTDGTLWAVGANSSYGQLGINTTVNMSSPVQIGALTSWSKLSKISGIGDNGAAIQDNGTAWVWGSNAQRQLFDGADRSNHRSSPVQVGSDTNWNNISTGGGYFLAGKELRRGMS